MPRHPGKKQVASKVRTIKRAVKKQAVKRKGKK